MKKQIKTIAVAILFLSSCSTGKINAYPEDIKANFINSCVNSGSNQGQCYCMIEKFQIKYTLEEFSAIELKMKAGQTPTGFLEFASKARVECMKK